MSIQKLTADTLTLTLPARHRTPLIIHDFLALQPRLTSVLDRFLLSPQPYQSRFLLLKGESDPLFYDLLNRYVTTHISAKSYHYHYQINDRVIHFLPHKLRGNMSTRSSVMTAKTVDHESLFGTVRQPEHRPLQLISGLLHQANGGALIIDLNALLQQPELFDQLKSMVIHETFSWRTRDESAPYPLSIPDMPLDLRLILIGDRWALGECQALDPIFFQHCFYGEFESTYAIPPSRSPSNDNCDPSGRPLTTIPSSADHDVHHWLDYVRWIAKTVHHIELSDALNLPLLKEGMRYCDDHFHLPLAPQWINTWLSSRQIAPSSSLSLEQFTSILEEQRWQRSYLPERLRAAILDKQVMIATDGERVGQINGLSVVEYPGYPEEMGEPSRISCVISIGDGDVIDVERKTELAGNLHAKGMMIIEALMYREFCQRHRLPFNFSLVFEQSYNEVDGDSASLAGFCALLSSLSTVPIDQQIAVTGSIDQFGNVQAIGGLNQKIRGFFDICVARGLTGKQGVIFPAINQRHLCLDDDLIAAVERGDFSLWAIDHFTDAVPLLMGLPYQDETPFNLKQVIATKIKNGTVLAQAPSKTWWQKLFHRSA